MGWREAERGGKRMGSGGQGEGKVGKVGWNQVTVGRGGEERG